MTLSIWRYSHLTLAISSFLFIIIAAVTGIILAFEPISNQLEPFAISELSSISVAETLEGLQEEYDEVIAVEVDGNNYVTASVITKEGNNETFYIDPKTGKKLGAIIEKAPIYKFATSLHRSLFLKSIGRFFVGLFSFLLFLISISGFVLILKRQGRFQKFFNKITWENFYQYFHVVLGRLSLIPLIIITVTGVYLSLEKFNVFPKEKVQHQIDFEALSSKPKRTIATFPIFQNTKLSEVRKIEFPFSTDVEDYFLIQLIDKELTINQITGEVLSEVHYPFTKLASYYSLLLHTGQGSIMWAIVLALTCIATLFFIYSGFVMTFQRMKGNIRNRYKKHECEYVILVGTENGSTKSFAKMLYKAFLQANQKVFVTDLNAYTSFPKMKHLIVLTATYGNGDAPSNATKFLKLLRERKVNLNPFNFSVVAFGSLSYPKFCQFGIEVQLGLEVKEEASQLLPIQTIHNKSFEAFAAWTQAFCNKTNLNLTLDKAIISKRKKTSSFILTEKKLSTTTEDTFLLKFENGSQKFTSGDLLGIYPNSTTHERLYSIANVEDSLLLSIKKHELGVCSNYLYNLKEGETINAFVQRNPSFHFPKKASKVIMIATGTGIAPFLGMLKETSKIPVDLYFGVRTQESLKIYEDTLNESRLNNVQYAFSRASSEKIYVQDLIQKDINKVLADLDKGAVLMLCGAIAMQNSVFQILEKALQQKGKSLSYYEKRKQILVDCY
ncbi:PepSY domain-containing protein [Tenacibaculum amylolyticum]|uniref:PepSY domain-containing protein n=1 Tax=Tenacibaculum amylolyticum TaxID=104269 RepID=UPI003894D546